MRRTAKVLSLGSVAATLWLHVAHAHADAVDSPPDSCPEGKVPYSDHGGAGCTPEAPKDCPPGYRGRVGGRCELWLCSTHDGCDDGRRCMQVDVCSEYRELNWTGWGWSAARESVTGNLFAEPPSAPPEGDPPEAWVKYGICGQDGPCKDPAECRPTGLCYPPSAVGKTKANVSTTTPPPEELPEHVYAGSLISGDRAPDGSGASPPDGSSSGGCRKGCALSSTPSLMGWLGLPLVIGVGYLRRSRRGSRTRDRSGAKHP
jgi:hypothetical protein